MSDATPIRNPTADQLLTPQNAVLALIDYQPEQYKGVASVDQSPTPLAASAGLRTNRQCSG
jgi:hypothetical protein